MQNKPTALKLSVGDVVYLTTLVRGFVPGHQAAYPPSWQTVRIPIRKIADSASHAPGFAAELTPNEAALLVSTLAVYGYGSLGTAQSTVDQSKVKLWNGFVDNLYLTKNSSEQPPRLTLELVGFCETIGTLHLESEFFAACQSILHPPTNVPPSPDYVEPRGIGSFGKDLSPVGDPKTSNLQPPTFYQGSVIASTSAQLEKDSVQMRNRGGDESRWSLADWESSGICPDRILNVTLRGNPFWQLSVVKDKAQWSFSVGNDGSRTLDPKNSLGRFGTLSRSSLALLFPSDVTGVLWGDKEDQAAQVDRHLEHTCEP